VINDLWFDVILAYVLDQHHNLKPIGQCYRTVCSLGHRLKDRDQTGVTGTFPTQCHLDGEVLSVEGG
jgi:hypothetical protein